MTKKRVPSKNEILTATDHLRQIVVRTPLITSQAMTEKLDAADIKIKAESMQWTGSFKVRGASWRCQQLTEAERKAGVVAYSSGNFAQGLAAAATRLGIPSTIVMPIDAPEIKQKKTKAYGADIVLSDHGSRPREEVASKIAQSLAKEKGMTLLHPFDDPLIITGHASAAVEVVEELAFTGAPPPDIVLSSVGGGGFASGIAMGFHYLIPEVEVMFVEPKGYNGFGTSLSAQKITKISGDQTTICDALQATAPGQAPFACAQFAGVQSHVTVEDQSVLQAMQFAFDNFKIVLEPSGAAAIAALFEHAELFKGKRVIAFTTGGNITLKNLVTLLTAHTG